MGASEPEPLTTYLELRASRPDGEEADGLSHKAGGLVLLHVLEVAARGEPRGGITLVHDAGDHGGRYLDAARAWAKAGWAVALPDMRGHGRSEGERGHSAGIREVLRDLDQVQQHLAYRLPTAPRVLVGQGLGALYCLVHALDRPGDTAALVLLAPRLAPRFAPPAAAGWKRLFGKPAPTAACPVGNDPAALTSDAAEQAAWRGDPLVHDTISARAAEQAAEAARGALPRVAGLALPVLVLHGGEDTLADPALSRSLAAPRLEVRLLEGRRHDLLHERGREELCAEISDWIGRALGA
jgi:acylglycerol lipase